MDARVEVSTGTADDDARSKRLALRLAFATALAGANASVIFATGAIIGSAMAPSPAYATVPLSVFAVGMASGTLPIGAIARRRGRRAAFFAGCLAGASCGMIAALAIFMGSFALFCAATFFGGVYSAASQSYRFAAADGASRGFAPKAISWVMAGGVFAGVIGPQLVQWTMDLYAPYLFAATFIGQAIIALVAMAVLSGVEPPPPAALATAGSRALADIVSQPRFIVAALCGTVSYALMNLVMTSAPLAMKICGLSLTQSNLGIQWHVLAMYGPSFVTGSLITRFGAARIVILGLALESAAAVIDLSGVSVEHFWSGLIALGLGWNFSWVGASAMVVAAHLPQERTRVQSFNDFVIFGTMAVGSFSSGQLLANYGWGWVNYIVFPPAVIALAGLYWERSRAASPAKPA